MTARLHRIRLEAEGSSAAAVEGELAVALARIARVAGLDLLVESQVIELNENRRPKSAGEVEDDGTVHRVDDPMTPWRDGWYFGRLVAFPHGNEPR